MSVSQVLLAAAKQLDAAGNRQLVSGNTILQAGGDHATLCYYGDYFQHDIRAHWELRVLALILASTIAESERL